MEIFDLIISSENVVDKNRKRIIVDILIFASLISSCFLLIFVDFRIISVFKGGFAGLIGAMFGYFISHRKYFKEKKWIRISDTSLVFSRSFNRDIKINFQDVKNISITLTELQIDFTDYVKTVDLTWLSAIQCQKLKDRLHVYMKKD